MDFKRKAKELHGGGEFTPEPHLDLTEQALAESFHAGRIAGLGEVIPDDVCCCGDPMKGHPVMDGHQAVSQLADYLSKKVSA